MPILQSKYTIRAQAGRSELMIYGDIGENWWAEESNDAKTVVKKIAKLSGPVDVRINSYGGVVADALAIYNALRRHKGDVTTNIDGIAYSAASLIAMAGQNINMAANAMMMIHAPWAIAVGNANDMRLSADVLEKFADAMVSSYSRDGKVDADLASDWLKDGEDHYFSADEAADAGLVDGITDSIDIAAALRGVERYQTPHAGTHPTEDVMSDIKEQPGGDTIAQPDQFVANHKTVVAKSKAQGATGERKRIREIQDLFKGYADDPASEAAALMEACIDDAACTMERAQGRLIELMRGETAEPIPAAASAADHTFTPRRERAAAGPDTSDKFLEGATKALLIRSGMEKDQKVIAAERSSEYLSMTMVELAKHSLRMSGQPVHGNQEDVLRRVLMAGPGQGTDHFPAILENIANKAVMDGFLSAEESWASWTIPGTLNDYRTASRVNKSLFDKLDKMEEYEAFKSGRFADVKQSITGFLHGKSFSLTLQALVNDDLGILSEDARAWGEAGNVTIGDAVFTALTVAGSGGFGQTMDEDSQILFHADHSNYIASGSGGAPAQATIQAGRTAMMTQTDPNSRIVASAPRYLIHGTTLTMAVFSLLNSQSYITGVDGTIGERNPVASLGLAGVEEYRMDAFVSTAWILAAARRTVEVSFVGGQRTPRVDRMPSGEIPGVTWQISIPFGVAALDFRTLYFNHGA